MGKPSQHQLKLLGSLLQCLPQAQLHLCKSNLIQTPTYYLYFVTFAFSLYQISLHDLDKRKNKMLQERAEIPLIGCKIIKKYIQFG